MRIALVLMGSVLACGLLYYFLKSNSAARDHQHNGHDLVHENKHDHTHDPHTETSNGEVHSGSKETSGKVDLPSAISQFNYKQEAQEILNLAKQWPTSKSKLLQITLNEDEFKKNKIAVAPHTANEILQRKMGAVKIMSLRVLLEKELSKEKKLQDLDYISQNTKDTTIQRIAVEARKSESNDRPFFKDTIEAISNLEITD
jgi:hypothetical protein